MNCLHARSIATIGRYGEINTNDFHKDLEYSLECRDDEILNEFYIRAFPLAERIEFCEDMDSQTSGVDKIIHFPGGRMVTVDEKKRRKDYGDILLELLKNKEKKRPGWLFYSECDYIVYAVMDAKKVYLLPVLLLQMAWKNNRKTWEGKYEKKDALNIGYTTQNIPIPTSVLLNAIRSEMDNCIDTA